MKLDVESMMLLTGNLEACGESGIKFDHECLRVNKLTNLDSMILRRTLAMMMMLEV